MIEIKLTKQAKTLALIDFKPKRATNHDAGYDLRACIEENLKVFPDQVVKVPTGVHVAIPAKSNLAGFLMPRGGINGLMLTNSVGLLDANYQGELFLKWRTVSAGVVEIAIGERLAQLVFVPVSHPVLVEVVEFEAEVSRGLGDGSSGRL